MFRCQCPSSFYKEVLSHHSILNYGLQNTWKMKQFAMQLKIFYYGADISWKDLCNHCRTEETVVCIKLKTKYKTVLLMRDACKQKGNKPFTILPFGRVKEKAIPKKNNNWIDVQHKNMNPLKLSLYIIEFISLFCLFFYEWEWY